ncbi:MAG TPA: transcription-repair coupling factor [Acidobacteriota bacterium]|nr:transcription-repair coupling factor [Acidobacteriota bacterium]
MARETTNSSASSAEQERQHPILDRLSSALKIEEGVLGGLHPADTALLLAALFHSRQNKLLLWICRDNAEAEKRAQDLGFFLPRRWRPNVVILPETEADPYRGLSPHPDILARRALALWKLTHLSRALVVTTASAVSRRLPSRANFLSHCLHLEVGAMMPRGHLVEKLREVGYLQEDPVNEEGEFSLRGGIIDVYSPSRRHPVRIEFFGDEVESIREFDPSTQRSVELVPQCEIIPMREMPVTDSEIRRWHEEAPEHWNEVRFAEALREKRQFTADKELFNGFEALFPLVVDCGSHLFDYRPQGETAEDWRWVVSSPEQVLDEMRDRLQRCRDDFQIRGEDGDLALPPERLMWTERWWKERLRSQSVLSVDPRPGEPEDFAFDFQTERKYHGRLPDLVADLSSWKEEGGRILFVMHTQGMAERLHDILGQYDISAAQAEGFEDLSAQVSVLQGRLSHGFYSPSLGVHLLTQQDVFEESKLQRPARRPPKRDLTGTFLSDFRDLREGDYVVHIDHGIGQYRGLKQIGVGEDSKEFALLSYYGGSKLYVPIDRLDLVQKYSASGDAKPSLDRLGGASWEKTKKRIKKSMRDMADELLKLYAQRAVVKGHAFPPDDELMREFEESFEFTETEDQAAAIRDVKADMEADQPMDRLICGDVGYGKTEVAMRAAFKAVCDNKQVAILAPTTVLAFQHFNTFSERMQGFPVIVEMISRFRSRQEQKEILKKVEAGTVDILIGTHRLLSKDVQFDRLGLVIIDEEQRFGVAHKEKLKKLKTKVDVLTLSATPIPRTLNMSLIGLRDLSIIETPPRDRLAIQTVVLKFSRQIIQSAIDLELKRKGQVFFLHNSVETIHSIAQMVQDSVPEARVAIAHGQMRENSLEKVMLDFVDYKYDVLVCTTIIENGLDISRANTLVVNRADRFGLAQLYQLRGRVGRSNRRAYAYLLIPTEEVLSSDARRRLKAIREFSDLGAGFRIAALDLEIRGAGNLLGGEQSGQINAVGFELYSKLLEQTIGELKGKPLEDEVQTSIDLRLDIQIPDHYIEDSNQRLWLYKRISSASDEQALESLRDETVDRHGKLPRSLSNLFGQARLRLAARRLRVLSIDRKGSELMLKFRHDTPVQPEQIIELVKAGRGVSLTPEGVVILQADTSRVSEIFESVHSLLGELAVLQ